MVDISHETAEQTSRRLEAVIKSARLVVYAKPYRFVEFALVDFPHKVSPEALALVRDDVVWSQLVPIEQIGDDTFALWRFYFPSGADNSAS